MNIYGERPFYRIRSVATGEFYNGTEVVEWGVRIGEWTDYDGKKKPYRINYPIKINTKWGIDNYRICVKPSTIKRWLKEIKQYGKLKKVVIEKVLVKEVEVIEEVNL